ncbi:hypothetical protein BBJ28_00015534 [Nothophytophthora sp. Chile5]|nr:hypothetical protein BBJ28_00015534 [Nothophytophthora sp. Chile5]
MFHLRSPKWTNRIVSHFPSLCHEGDAAQADLSALQFKPRTMRAWLIAVLLVCFTTSDGGLATWQIALIICCGVLVFTVAVVSVLSCYCKARNRLYENEDAQADVSYYHQPYPGTRDNIVIGDGAGAAAAAGAATPSLFAQAPNSSRSQQRRSGSFTNDLKPLYANSAQNNPDRIGLGLAPVHARSSSGDLAGSYPNERRPSASNRSVGRRPSLEQQYSARDRDSFAVEL